MCSEFDMEYDIPSDTGDEFDDLIDDMSIEELRNMKDLIVSGDEQMMEFLDPYLSNDTDDDDDPPVLQRVLRR